MVKKITHFDTELSVIIKNSTEETQQAWGSGLFFDRNVLNKIKEVYKGGCIIDVGAGIGNYALYFAGVLGACTHCFEPDPEKFDRLRKNLNLNNLKTRSMTYALLDYAGYARKEEGTGIKYIKSTRELFNVSVTTLDSVMFEKVSVIRIDVKDMEAKIISGSRRVIKENLPHMVIRTEEPTSILEKLNTMTGNKYMQGQKLNNKTYHFYAK
jgi:FkbM family methyltransferase